MTEELYLRLQERGHEERNGDEQSLTKGHLTSPV